MTFTELSPSHRTGKNNGQETAETTHLEHLYQHVPPFPRRPLQIEALDCFSIVPLRRWSLVECRLRRERYLGPLVGTRRNAGKYCRKREGNQKSPHYVDET